MPMLLPVLTAYEKDHIADRQPLPERYLGLSDEEIGLTQFQHEVEAAFREPVQFPGLSFSWRVRLGVRRAG